MAGLSNGACGHVSTKPGFAPVSQVPPRVLGAAIESDRSSGEAYASFLRAELLQEHGALPEAIAQIKEALVHDPDSPYLMHRLSELLWASGAWEKALQWNQKASGKKRQPIFACWRAFMLSKMGSSSEAKSILREMMGRDQLPHSCVSQALTILVESPVDTELLTQFHEGVLLTQRGPQQAAYIMAESLFEAGQWEMGDRYFTQAQNLNPADVEVLSLAWRYAMVFQDTKGVEEAAKGLYIEQPSTRNAHRWILTRLLHGEEQKAAALSPQLFEHSSIKTDTAIWWPWFLLGLEDRARVYFGLRRIPKAIQKAMEQDGLASISPEAKIKKFCHADIESKKLQNCVENLIQAKRFGKANSLLLKRLTDKKMDGTLIRLWLRLAAGPSPEVNQRQMERVFHLFVLEHEPDMEFYIAQIEAKAHYSGADAALALADEMLHEGNHAKTWAVGFWFLENGYASDALDVIEGLLRQASRMEPYLLNLWAYTLAENNSRLEEAIEASQRALLGDPLNGALLDTLGWAFYRDGQIDKALWALSRAHYLMPREAEIAFHLAKAYQSASQPEKALATLERVRDVFTFSKRLQRRIEKLRDALMLEIKGGT
tara:strand:- start:2087 stop:3886 length:1800 start_codon:yes stop_codon:yes gene_type:complete